MPLSDQGRVYGSWPKSWNALEETAAALQEAAASSAGGGDTSAVGQLLPSGVDVDNFGWTALHYAAAAGSKSLVQQSLNAGIAVDCRGYEDFTPLFCAVEYGCAAVIEQLIEQGANVHAKTSSWLCRTALHEAAAQGNIAATELLLAGGAAVDAVSIDGSTPLHAAALKGHPAVIESLLAKGAAVNAGNKANTTPLHEAAYSGRPAAVQLLLAKGAAVDAVDSEGMTPLHDAAAYTYAAEGRDHVAVAELLLEHGAAVDAASRGGRTPLHRAASNGKTDLVKLLLSKGAAVRAQDHYGRTPLSCAVERIEEEDDPDLKLDVFNVVLQAGHPWPSAALVAAAGKAICRELPPNRTAFAVLAKAIFLSDKAAFEQLLEELGLQGEDAAAMADEVVTAVMEEWCSDVASLDKQRAELLEQRRDVEAQRKAVQHMIVNGACLTKHVAKSATSSTGDGRHGVCTPAAQQ